MRLLKINQSPMALFFFAILLHFMTKKVNKKCNKSLLYSKKKFTPYPSCNLRQPAFDLFGDVVVTEEDLFLWVAAVAPRWLSPLRSYKNYLRGYNVAEKVRNAKINGTWQPTIDNIYTPWHERFALNCIL